MLRAFLRIFWSSPQPPTPVIQADSKRSGKVVLYAQVDPPPPQATGKVGAAPLQPKASNHRERLMAMRLEHTRLCSVKRCERLRTLGVLTAGDLVTADLRELAGGFGAPNKALRILKLYRRAIRLAASVPGMMPPDAMLLISIHRRSVRGLALETPASLHRDLQRYAESTPGRRQLRGRRVPSTRRIKRWISACEANARNTPLHVPAL
ncbi:MAG: DUF4332 domain-containing protein [Pirellulales bacterium]|nr:DUF4332 domain-containing protein [Pirellulales bacterium]